MIVHKQTFRGKGTELDAIGKKFGIKFEKLPFSRICKEMVTHRIDDQRPTHQDKMFHRTLVHTVLGGISVEEITAMLKKLADEIKETCAELEKTAAQVLSMLKD